MLQQIFLTLKEKIMKNSSNLILKCLAIFCCMAGFSHLATAQVKTNKKINPTQVNKKTIYNTTNLKVVYKDLPKPVPFFSNIKPININTLPSVKNIVKRKNVSVLPAQRFTVHSSSVNGVMTARHPYTNSLAYLEFLNGDVHPGNNTVDCHCGSGLTYVKLILHATAGKRYLVTTVVSPRNGNSFGLDFFTRDFVHHAGANHNNEAISIVLSPEQTGTIELWMQCSDPNGAKRPWRFHSLEVEEID